MTTLISNDYQSYLVAVAVTDLILWQRGSSVGYCLEPRPASFARLVGGAFRVVGLLRSDAWRWSQQSMVASAVCVTFSPSWKGVFRLV